MQIGARAQKVLTFRREGISKWQDILREVADYLEGAPDVEDNVEFMFFDMLISEPPAGQDDCDTERQAQVFVALGREFDKVPIGEIR